MIYEPRVDLSHLRSNKVQRPSNCISTYYTDHLTLFLRDHFQMSYNSDALDMEQTSFKLPSNHLKTYYQYESLDSSQHQIRLLHLQPSTSNEHIECHLETVDLRSSPKYEALSYEWGDPTMFQPEIKLGQNIVLARNNLWWALHHLRLLQSTRVLWTDALCINQNNISERNSQVSEMKRIYSQAFQVVAWIGREEDSSGDCLFLETKTAMNFLITLASRPLKDYPYSLGLEKGKRSLIFSPHASKWDALCIMLNRKYWRRLWIIQEFILAPEVLLQCGSWSIPWTVCSDILARLTKWSLSDSVAVHPRLLTSLSYQMDKRRKERQIAQLPGDSKQDYDAPLANLVTEFGEALCLDPRDKIFGLLSLSRGCCRDAITVNYSAMPITVSAELLAHHVSQHCLDSGKGTIAKAKSVLERLRLLPTIPCQGMDFREYPISHESYLKAIRDCDSNFQALVTPIWARVPLSVGGWYHGKIVQLYIPMQNAALARQSPLHNMRVTKELLFLRIGGQQDEQIRLLGPYFNPNSSFQHFLKPQHISGISTIPSVVKPSLFSPRHIMKGGIHPKQETIESSSANFPSLETPNLYYGIGGINLRNYKLTVKQLGHAYEALQIDCGVAFFLTSSGLAGCVTNNVKLGDEVFELSGPDCRVAVLNGNINSSTELVGKGRTETIISTDPSKQASIQTINIDIAALLYLTGCF